jgi:hypothetical protein
LLVLTKQPVAGNACDHYNEDCSGAQVRPRIFHQFQDVRLHRALRLAPYTTPRAGLIEQQMVAHAINLDTINQLYGLNPDH